MDRDKYTYKYGHLYKKVSEEDLDRELARKLALEKQIEREREREQAEWREYLRERKARDRAERIAWLEAETAAREALRLLEQAREARRAAIRGGKVVYVLEKTQKRFSRPKVRLLKTAVTDALFYDAIDRRQEAWEKRQQKAEEVARKEQARRSMGKTTGGNFVDLQPSYEYRVATMAYGGNDGSYPYGRWVRSKGSSDAQWGDSMIWD